MEHCSPLPRMLCPIPNSYSSFKALFFFSQGAFCPFLQEVFSPLHLGSPSLRPQVETYLHGLQKLIGLPGKLLWVNEVTPEPHPPPVLTASPPAFVWSARSYLGHVGDHPLSYSTQAWASLSGALRGTGGGCGWEENWAETGVNQWQVYPLPPRADCPPSPGLPRVSLGSIFTPKYRGPGSWLSCPWELGKSVQTKGCARVGLRSRTWWEGPGSVDKMLQLPEVPSFR